MMMPKQISISDKSMLFDGCPTAKLRKKISVEPCVSVFGLNQGSD